MCKKIFYTVIILIVLSCQNNNNISDTDIAVEIKRFEKDIFEVDPSKIEDRIPELKQKYNEFLEIFGNRIIGIGSTSGPMYTEFLKQFITDYNNFKIYQRTLEIFPDLSDLNIELNKAFSTYRYYFPEKPVPQVFTYVSGFNHSAISDSNLLAIGLDKYLGVNEELYDLAGIYNYLRINMHKDKIPSDCMRLWAMTEFEFNDSIGNLATNIVYEGMIMYFVNKILPDHPDTLKWGFTKNQLEFCKKNEKQMWTYLIENKILFSSDKFTIGKFINEGPFTKDFSENSPARAAVWLGFNIVNAYAAKNNVDLHRLMIERNYLEILNNSGYNP